MKGYIFSLSASSPIEVMRSGLHGVWQPPPTDQSGRERDWRVATWSHPMLATFSDYVTVKPGDLVFFFASRLIYGIGRVTDPLGSDRGALLNYPGASEPSPVEPRPDTALVGPAESPEWRRLRVVIPFEPDPQYFDVGIDMDEVLASPGADAAWGLRFWEGYSFQQLGEAEVRLLLSVFERRFGNAPGGPSAHVVTQGPMTWRSRLDPTIHKPFLVSEMVAAHPETYLRDGEFRNEEVVHALITEALDPPTGRPRGVLADECRLDVYHELAASPPKPPVWADRMDVVGTRHYPGPGSSSSTAAHYDVVEAKKDRLGGGARGHDRTVSQLMKYVDFVSRNYCGGNYSAVSAYFIAAGYDDEFVRRHEDAQRVADPVLARSYVLNPRESPPTRRWSRVQLLTYEWSQRDLAIHLMPATPA
jgi:hypothetical protein